MDFAAYGIQTHFTALDWTIVAVYLSASVIVGLVAQRYISNMSDYIVAGRSLRSYLGIATLIGTEFGLVSVANGAQKGFNGGFSALHLGLLGLVVTLFVGFTGVVLVPLRRAGVMTIPEYYEQRFSKGVRIYGGLIMLIAGVCNVGIYIKGGAVFIMGLTGMTSDFHMKLFMTGMLALVLFYTTLGGMVSVVMADYIQFVVMSFGLLASCVLAVHFLGWENIINTVAAARGEAGFNPFDEAGFGATYVIYMAYAAFASCALWQTTVVRACSVDSERTVKRVISGSAIGFMCRMTVPILFGVCAFTFISQHPALRAHFLPEGGATSETTLMATPVFLSQLLPTGLLGLVTAGMLAAFLSTHDSYMLCWSAVFVQDVVAPLRKKGLSTRTRLLLSRLFLLLEGAVILVFGLWYTLGQDLWDYMIITGAIYFVGAGAVLVLGIYWRRASTAGAYAALTVGFGAFLGLKPLQHALGFDIPTEQVGLAMALLAFALMLGVSLLFPDKKQPEEETTTV